MTALPLGVLPLAVALLSAPIIQPAAALPPVNLVTSVTVITIENHGRAATDSGMPKIAALGRRYAKSSNTFAITHPSKPNYFVVWSGSMQGEDGSDRYAQERAPSLFDEVASTGERVKTYGQSMGSAASTRCRITNNGPYVFRHNPQVMFTTGSVRLPDGTTRTKRSICIQHNRDGFNSYRRWWNDLASDRLGILSNVIPDNLHNWHDGPYSSAAAHRSDDWISARAQEYIKSPAYARGGVLIITADEARPSSKVNDIPMYVVHKSLDGRHLVTPTRLNLYDMHHFLAEAAHVRAYGGRPNVFASTFGLVPA